MREKQQRLSLFRATLLQSGEYASTERGHGCEFNEEEGEFLKWNNNDDFVLEEKGVIDPYPQALSHFSFVESRQAYLLTDVQGWRPGQCHYILTDPALHTNAKKGVKPFPGGADHGRKGMKNFLNKHRCNDICRLLGLDQDCRLK